jgi:hypothetical protein
MTQRVEDINRLKLPHIVVHTISLVNILLATEPAIIIILDTAIIRVNHTITRQFSEDYLKKLFLAFLAVDNFMPY